jgi:hypothetical protein
MCGYSGSWVRGDKYPLAIQPHLCALIACRKAVSPVRTPVPYSQLCGILIYTTTAAIDVHRILKAAVLDGKCPY